MSLRYPLNRREFLKKSGTIGLTAGLTSSISSAVKARPKSPSIKISLYSVTFSGAWYDGPALTIKEFIQKAKSIGYDGIELGAKRPHASPLDLDKQDCIEIRRMVDSAELEICAVASYNNFTNPIVEQRENELLMLREQMRIANYLGVKIVRVFAAWGGVTMIDGKAYYDDARRAWSIGFPEVTREQKWKLCRECFKESIKYAKKFDITLAFQNHKPLIRNYKDTIKMVKEIGSENLKLSLDAPLFNNQDDEYVRGAVMEAGKDLIVHSHFGGEFNRKSDGSVIQRKFRPGRELSNYPVFIKALTEIGYNGHISYELCHPFIIKGKYGTLKDSEEQAALALEYLKNILSRV